MKPMDFVRTPKGHIAIITETNYNGKQASITFIGKINDFEHNAWWNIEELEVIDSLPNLLGKAMAHPFGSGKPDVDKFFPVDIKLQRVVSNG